MSRIFLTCLALLTSASFTRGKTPLFSNKTIDWLAIS
ncbi:Uncharacterised protein [Segatella copri]|nr:Uncharacterised protein [Segatella copri]